MGELDLTPRQYAVLETVADDPGINQHLLGRLTGVDRSTVSNVARRLVETGLLQRRRRKDGRIFSLQVTPQGQRMLAQARPRALKADAILLAALPEWHVDTFMLALRSLANCNDEDRR